MEKEKILPGIKSRISTLPNGEKITLSERTIDDYVLNIAKLVNDESELTENFYTAHIGILKSLNGNFNYDLSVQVEEVKKNFTHTSQATPPVNQQQIEEKSLFVAKIEQMEKFINDFNDKQEQAAKEEKKSFIINAARKIATSQTDDGKGGWSSNGGVLDASLLKVQFDENDTPETFSLKWEHAYNNMYTGIFGNGPAPMTGCGGNDKIDTDWVAIEKKRLQDKGMLPPDKA